MGRHERQPEDRIPALVFLAFVPLGLMLVLEYTRVHHVLRPDGLEFGRLLGAREVLRWDEARRLHYSPSMKRFRIETHDGRVARISALLTGPPEFARAALAHVPAQAIDPTTRPILEATARGELPPVGSA